MRVASIVYTKKDSAEIVLENVDPLQLNDIRYGMRLNIPVLTIQHLRVDAEGPRDIVGDEAVKRLSIVPVTTTDGEDAIARFSKWPRKTKETSTFVDSTKKKAKDDDNTHVKRECVACMARANMDVRAPVLCSKCGIFQLRKISEDKTEYVANDFARDDLNDEGKEWPLFRLDVKANATNVDADGILQITTDDVRCVNDPHLRLVPRLPLTRIVQNQHVRWTMRAILAANGHVSTQAVSTCTYVFEKRIVFTQTPTVEEIARLRNFARFAPRLRANDFENDDAAFVEHVERTSYYMGPALQSCPRCLESCMYVETYTDRSALFRLTSRGQYAIESLVRNFFIPKVKETAACRS